MNELTYYAVEEYLLPNLKLSDPPAPTWQIRYYAQKYLREERPALYASLLLSERLYPLCRSVDEAAAHRLTTIENREIAHEVILAELVYI